MKTNPIFSIIIPCYNLGQYINEAVNSVLEQTFKDFEIIIIDDGSTDEVTNKILKSYSNPYIYIYYTKNNGPASARNFGIRRAKGKYILPLDADDKIDKTYLGKAFEVLEMRSDVGFVTPWFTTFGLSNDIYKTEEFNFENCLLKNNTTGCSVFRIEAWEQVGGYDEKWGKDGSYEDWDFWISIFKKGWKNFILKEFLFFYRKRKNSNLEKSDKKREELMRFLFEKHSDIFNKFGKDLLIKTENDFNKYYADTIIELKERDSILSKKENDYISLHDKYIKLENKNIKLENELSDSNREIYLIKSSTTWKLGGIYFHYKNILNPSRLFFLFKKAVVVLKRDGFISFLKRINRLYFNNSGKSVFLNKPKKIIKKNQDKWPEDKPLLSIVTAFYNAGSTINETIQSVFSQTFQDFEYIIVDDGSIDKESKNVFDNIDNPRIMKIKEENHGPAFARNNGIENANGKYILCLDADDTIDSTYLEKAVSILELNPQYDIVYSDMNLFGSETGAYREPEFDPYKLLEENILICASVFKKTIWEKTGGYKSGIGFEDWEFWINLVENGAQPKHILETLFNYRKANISRFVGDKKNIPENVRKIRVLHPNYNKNIVQIMNTRVPVKFKFKNDDAFLNINNAEKYLNNSGKKSILLLMPWLSFGGAETLVYNYCSKINNDFNISIMTGLKSENNWDFKFKEITKNIYHLPNLFEDEENYLDFILNYIKTRHIEVIHIIHNSCFYYMLPEIKKRFPKIKVISTVFNVVADHFNNSIKYEKYINIFTTDNTKVLNAYNKQLIGSKLNKIVIFNGIDCKEKFNPILYNRLSERSKMGIGNDDISIYFIGRLSPEKNPDIFVKAAKKVIEKRINVKFFIVGDGIMRNEIEKLIKRFNHKNLTYLGYQTDIPRYLSTADIFILPSSAEGFPLSNIEAMSMGICVIASDVGGVSDEIIDGENGFLIKPNSVDELVNKIEFILNKKNILNKISKNARKSVEEKFSIEILAEKYTDLYKNQNE